MEKFSTTLERQLTELTNTIVEAVHTLRDTIIVETENIRKAKVTIEDCSNELSNISAVLEEFATDITTIVDVTDTLVETADMVTDALDEIPEENEMNTPQINLEEDTPIYEIDENGEYHEIG